MTKKPRTKNRPGTDRPTITITLPSGWGRAGAAGVLAAFLGWVIPVAVAMASFWAVAYSPWFRQLTWRDAAEAGSSYWALSLGSPATLGQVSVSAIPMLWSLAQLVSLRLFLGRMRRFTPASVWAAIPAFVGTSLVLVLPMAVGVIWWRAALGATVISALACLWAYRSVAQVPPGWTRWLRPPAIGILLGLTYLLVANIVGISAVVTQTISNFEAVQSATQSLQGPGGGAVMLWLIQISYLPLGAGWAASWLAGTGFVGVGGELVSPATPPTVELPLPAWQLVPTAETHGYEWVFLLLSLVLGGILLVLLRRQHMGFTAAVLAVGTTVGTVTIAAWMALSNGSLGVGTLAHLGPDTWAAATKISLLMLVIPFVLPLIFHTTTVTAVRGLVERYAGSGTSEPSLPGSGPGSGDPVAEAEAEPVVEQVVEQSEEPAQNKETSHDG